MFILTWIVKVVGVVLTLFGGWLFYGAVRFCVLGEKDEGAMERLKEHTLVTVQAAQVSACIGSVVVLFAGLGILFHNLISVNFRMLMMVGGLIFISVPLPYVFSSLFKEKMDETYGSTKMRTVNYAGALFGTVLLVIAIYR